MGPGRGQAIAPTMLRGPLASQGVDSLLQGDHKGQYISNKRSSRFVILSGAKDLSPDRDPSLRSG